MLPHDSLGIVSAILFYLIAKFLCVVVQFRKPMHKKEHLSSIPEIEVEEDLKSTKWVPKKKHEVLKAKYKCLKKLFQIYDASVIGILPGTYDQVDENEADDASRERHHARKQRKPKADACAETVELASGDGGSVISEDKDKRTAAEG